MGSSFKVISPPSQEPISLSDAKAYLRVDFPDDDTVISGIITRVRSLAETITGRAFATQLIQLLHTIGRPTGGILSGPITPGINWYAYQEELGANPFGPAQFFFDLAMPPLQGDESNVSVQTKVVAFDPWQAFPLTTNTDGSKSMWLDTTSEPARLYFQSPITANFWQFTYTAGYSASYPVPPDLLQALYEGVAYFYQYREAEDLPKAMVSKFLAKRTEWI